MSQASIADIAREIERYDSFVICGHVSPDGDCLGSQLALQAALRKMGKKATCLLAFKEEIEYGLRFMPGIDEMVPASDYDGDAEAFVTVDVPSAERMGEEAALVHGRTPHTITIDHHLSEGDFSDVAYVDSHAPATSMIVWDLVKELGVEPDAAIATCVYVGIITDTGRFQYQNTTADALAVASEVVGFGADPAEIARNIYQNRSRQSLALEQRMLANLEIVGKGQFAMSHIMRSDFVETGARKPDAEPLIDVLRSIRGIRVACMLRQQTGSVRGSLRAKDDTDVARIAEQLGGGGHRAAAGFTFKGSMDDARDYVRNVFENL